jgi:diguanylate cyclase (GGDEF)-like protein/PAS domain S-box-containing protein
MLWLHAEPTEPGGTRLRGVVVDVSELAASVSSVALRDAAPFGEPRLPGRFSWDDRTRIVQVSDEAAELLGLDGAGAYPTDALRAAVSPECFRELTRRVTAAASGDVVDLLLTPAVDDGRRLHVRAMRSTGSAGGQSLTGTIQDVLEEELLGAALTNVARSLNTLSHGTHVLNSAATRQDLLDEVCATVVREGGYRFCWYGVAEHDDAKTISPCAWAGHEDGYLSTRQFHWDENVPTGRGPSGAAIRSGEVRLATSVASDSTFGPWRQDALDRGYLAVLALPVTVDGVVDGALMVYAAEATAFDPTEISLLSDLASGIGYGLQRLLGTDALVESTRAAEAARDRLQATIDTLLDPFVVFEAVRDDDGRLVDLRYVEANEAAAAYNAVPRSKLLGRRILELFPGHLADGPLSQYFSTIETGEPVIEDDLAYFNEVFGEVRRCDTRAVKCGDGIVLTWRDTTDRYQERQRVTESERRYRLLAENSSDVVFLSDRHMRFVWVSTSLGRATGWGLEDLVGHAQQEFVHPEDVEEYTARFSNRTGEPVQMKFRFRVANGEYRWMSASGRWATDEDGRVMGLVIGLRDIHDQVRTERELAEREARYRLLAENASDVVLQVGPDNRVRWASESITAVLGWEGRDVLGRVATELVHPDDRDEARDALFAVDPGDTVSGQVRVLRQDGTPRWMAVTVHNIGVDDASFRVLALRDVEDAVAARRDLEHAMGHDPLTGLATRATMLGRLRRMLDEVEGLESVAVLCVGIDGLKDVNEALTHTAGDLVITSVAGRVAGAVGDIERVGRGGGDEFTVLLPGLASGADASSLAERVRLAAQGAVQVGPHRLRQTVSIGIATGGAEADAEDLLRDASLAMQQAKGDGRDRTSFADAAQALEAKRRLDVESAIRVALVNGEFVPWFQPIVRLSDGQLTGYEALVRWVRPDGALVEPMAFLPVAERSPIITEIDLQVLEGAVAALDRVPSGVWVSVNVAARTLSTPEYADRVRALLRAHDVVPGRLHIEVTETALLRIDDGLRRTMSLLAEAGVRWYMDDFGTGYSSIAHLRDLPITGMKLDRSFTAALGSGDQTSARLAQALGGLALGLALDTVAEGVETRAEADVLESFGWVHGQGWLYGKAEPLPGGG